MACYSTSYCCICCWTGRCILNFSKQSDSTYTATSSGTYSVQVTNSICTELTFYSDTVSITAVAENFYSNNSSSNKLNTSFFISPNPAKEVLHLHINADANNAVINVYDLNGNKLIT